jgi:hypothetical protein
MYGSNPLKKKLSKVNLFRVKQQHDDNAVFVIEIAAEQK